MKQDRPWSEANSIEPLDDTERADRIDVLEQARSDEAVLMADAHARAQVYLDGVAGQDVYPGEVALRGLDTFDETLPETATPAVETLALLDCAGSPATAVSNGPNYFGFVIGGTLPVAAAAQRLAAAWDQCASSAVNSPVADRLERVAAGWLLDILDLPRGSGVAFGTSATAGRPCCAVGRAAGTSGPEGLGFRSRWPCRCPCDPRRRFGQGACHRSEGPAPIGFWCLRYRKRSDRRTWSHRPCAPARAG